MPVAAIPAIVWASAAAGGASVAGAAIAAHGASEAAKTQAQAGNNALNLQKQMFDEQQAAYAPYRQIGQSVLPSLARYAQAPIVSRGGPDRYQAAGGLTLGALSGLGQLPGVGMGAPASGFTPNGMGAGLGGDELVTVQAPTGETRQMPRAQAQRFVSLGARIL